MPLQPAQLRFTILEHDHPFLHWDLLMQQGDSLATWRLLQEPVCRQWIFSERLPDHRLMYLDYEGPVSNDRGHVRLFCTGHFSVVNASSKSAAAGDDREFQLANCEFGTRAFCHAYNSDNPKWRFE